MRAHGPIAGATAAVLVMSLSACGSSTESSPSATSSGPATGSSNPPGTGGDIPNAPAPDVAGVDQPPPAKTIVMKNIAFYPAAVTAKPGEKWTEVNQDIATHDIETDQGSNPGKLKAPDVAPGKQATFTMPTKVGVYHVVCIYHPSMTAIFTVK